VNNEKYAEFTAGPNDKGKRADRIIRQFIKDQPLSAIYKAFRKGLIRINDKKSKPETKVQEGDSIFIYKSLLETLENKPDTSPGAIKGLEKQIIYEDDKLLALNKLSGQIIHGEKGSLEEMVRNYLEGRISQSLSFRPGPLHRLDRNTSGLIFFSKSIEGAREFSEELQNKNFIKFYLALLDGKLTDKEQWIDNLERDSQKGISYVTKKGGKEAISTAWPLFTSDNYTLAVIKIETGRTHQIRVQASFHGYPLSGDSKYKGSPLQDGFFLHSLTIRSTRGKSSLIKKEITALPGKENIKRLNRVLTNCSIDGLEERIETILEDL
jgi:23S rRNA pseudouridine955/2504/2580 synthase